MKSLIIHPKRYIIHANMMMYMYLFDKTNRKINVMLHIHNRNSTFL
jgi:hypothetical protein